LHGDERAAVAFETVLMTPILVWAFIGSFVFFDAYRVYNTSVKTTYMVADMLSRQTTWSFPTTSRAWPMSPTASSEAPTRSRCASARSAWWAETTTWTGPMA
jgi:hypothetical protein